MPDGDIVHSKLSGCYWKSYQVLCEGKRDCNEYAWIVMGAVMRDIKRKGAAPVVLAKRMGESLKQFIDNAGENGSRDWAALSVELDRLARQARCPYYEKELVLQASDGILHEFRYGQRVDAANAPEAVVEKYFQEFYKSKFEARIPLTSNHPAGVDNPTLMERAKAISPKMFAEFNKWAKRANVDEDVANLRRSRRQKVNEIDLDEDLL